MNLPTARDMAISTFRMMETFFGVSTTYKLPKTVVKPTIRFSSKSITLQANTSLIKSLFHDIDIKKVKIRLLNRPLNQLQMGVSSVGSLPAPPWLSVQSNYKWMCHLLAHCQLLPGFQYKSITNGCVICWHIASSSLAFSTNQLQMDVSFVGTLPAPPWLSVQQ